MTASSWCIKLLLLGLVIAVVVASPWREEDDENPFAGRGYTTKINEVFIEQELLETDGETIVLSERGRADARVAEFFERSRLRDDARNANSGIWRIENNRLTGIEPSAHDIPLPSRERTRWRGSILFREPGAATSRSSLVGGFGAFAFAPPNFEAPEVASNRVPLRVFAGRGQRLAGPVALIQVSDPQNTFDIAEVAMWGDTPVVGAFSEGPFSLYVDNRLLRRDQRRAMAPGGTLEIRSTSGESAMLRATQEVDLASAISSYRPWQARQRAVAHERIAMAIEGAMTRTVATDADRTWATRDLVLTIDQGLDAGLHEVLNTFVEDHQGQWPQHVVAVTIMDSLNGEILAFASSESRDRENNDALDANFRRLQVGSAAKPLIAAAILQQHPQLVNLVIQPSGLGPDHHLETLLGVEMSSTNSLGSSTGGACDFDCFLQRSDNKYAASLLLLASTGEGEEEVDTGEPYQLGSRVLRRRTLSVFERRGSDGRTRWQTGRVVLPLDWDHQLAALFDLDYQTPGGVPSEGSERCGAAGERWGDDRFDLRIWRNVFSVSRRADPCVFAAISPWRENFKLDQQRDFEQGMLLTMIGGGEASWTNFKLAESYSRLVTGLNVHNSLVVADPNLDAETIEASLLDPNIRRRITHALTLTSMPGGTAANADLVAVLQRTRAELSGQGAVLGFFAKTGTPQLEIQFQNPATRAIHRLIGQGAVGLEPARTGLLEVRANGGTWRATRANRTTIVEALEAQGGEVRRAIASERANARAIVQRLIEENEGGAERIERNFSVRGNLLIGMTAHDYTEDEFGKVFAFVTGRYGPSASVGANGLVSDGMAMPQRAYAVVINIQNDVEGERMIAVNLGAEIMDHLLRPRLTRTNGRTERQ